VDIFETGTELEGGKVRSKSTDNGVCYRVFVNYAKFFFQNTRQVYLLLASLVITDCLPKQPKLFCVKKVVIGVFHIRT
jgi:hypothetical protein